MIVMNKHLKVDLTPSPLKFETDCFWFMIFSQLSGKKGPNSGRQSRKQKELLDKDPNA